ncbi:MAG: hypothetical protein M5R42_12595 [Rhodocyclaceae bacterium]|nr:hypothetical protein [Rhodocyclaceae bacterium]
MMARLLYNLALLFLLPYVGLHLLLRSREADGISAACRRTVRLFPLTPTLSP